MRSARTARQRRARTAPPTLLGTDERHRTHGLGAGHGLRRPSDNGATARSSDGATGHPHAGVLDLGAEHRPRPNGNCPMEPAECRATPSDRMNGGHQYRSPAPQSRLSIDVLWLADHGSSNAGDLLASSFTVLSPFIRWYPRASLPPATARPRSSDHPGPARTGRSCGHENMREPDPGDDHDGRAGVGSRLVDVPSVGSRAGWCYSTELLPRRGVVRAAAEATASSSPVVPSPLKIAAIALRRVCASRSISARTAWAFTRTAGSDLILSIQCSSARRISSVALRPVSWAMMSSWARSSSVMRLSLILIWPPLPAAAGDVSSLMRATSSVNCGRRTL